MERKFRLNWPALVEEAKQRRKAQNLTQQRLAKLAEVSTPTVSRFEGGEKDIQLSSALRLLGVLGLLDRRMLVFAEPDARYNSEKDIVAFWGRDGDKEVRCAISREAIDDRFKGDGKDKFKVYAANREAIEHEARRKYLAGKLEKDGSVLIRTADF
jgi:transcriptional regulator with XRE-family HTH domain